MVRCPFLLIQLLPLLVSYVSGSNISVSDFVTSLLHPDVYNKKERPFLDQGKELTVDVDIFVSSISGISEISMDFAINIFLRQRWKDPRLIFPPNAPYNSTLTLNHALLPMFWQSDLYMDNERTKGFFHDITIPNILLRLSPDGLILFSQRVSSRLACHMALQKYPLDVQYCNIILASYGHTTKDIIFRWTNIAEPIQINQDMQLPEFNLTGVKNGDCSTQYTTGTFSCINATFEFQRLFEYYLIQVYVPSILIVLLSWVSFWIDIHAVPARISVGLLTVLTITTQSSGISTNLPKVSYIKAIDVWMFTSMVFVFGGLIEYSIVNVLARSHKVKLALLRKKYGIKQRSLDDEEDGDVSVDVPVELFQTHHHIQENGFNHCTNPYSLTGASSHTNKQMAMGIHRRRSLCTNSNTSSGSSTYSAYRMCKMPDERHMTWCEKVQFNKALLVDVVSRVLFPSTYLFFNFLYWVFYLGIF